MLLTGLAVGLWGTIIRPPAYEVRGTVMLRATGNLLLVRHDPVPGLGMGAMDLMAVSADPATLDAAALAPGDRVRLAVRQRGDELVLLRVQKLP